MLSKTEIFLPGIFRNSSQFLTDYLQSGEKPLLDADKETEDFTDKLLPLTAPATWLGWLFYALGGNDYLRADFNTTKQRMVLSRLFELYRMRGTVDGIQKHFNILLNRELLGAHQPPAKAFCGVSMSQEERALFEARHPEIRIYPFRHNGVKQSFFISDCLGDPAGDYAVFPAQTDALFRTGDRVELFDPLANETTNLNSFHIEKEYVEKQAENIVEIRLKGRACGVFYYKSYLSGKTYLIDHEAGKRFYSIKLEGIYADEVQRRAPLSVIPTLTPFKTYYESMAVNGSAGYGMFLYNRYKDIYPDRGGAFCSLSHTSRSAASDRLYRRLKLFDPERSLPLYRRPGCYMGAVKIGALPAHRFEVSVDMTASAPAKAAWPGRFVSGNFCVSDAADRIAQMTWAGNLARRAGCKASVSIANRKTVRASSGALTGKYNVNQFLKEVI